MSDQVATLEQQDVKLVEFKRIFVAVDYLNLTIEVFAKAVELAKTYNSKLMIFHCVQGELPGVPVMDTFSSMGVYNDVYYQEMNEFYEKMRREATEKLLSWLRSFAEQVQEQGLMAEFDYKIGDPGKNICQVASNWGADLIVVGRRGRSGLSELFLGSVSNYVVHHANCSVLIVQQ